VYERGPVSTNPIEGEEPWLPGATFQHVKCFRSAPPRFVYSAQALQQRRAALGGDGGRERGIEIGVADVLDRDLDVMRRPPLLGVGVEPFVVSRNEMTPLRDRQGRASGNFSGKFSEPYFVEKWMGDGLTPETGSSDVAARPMASSLLNMTGAPPDPTRNFVVMDSGSAPSGAPRNDEVRT
jgi:hypothetical protein